MLLLFIYCFIGTLLAYAAWRFSEARFGKWEVSGTEPIYVISALFWPVALILLVVFAALKPLYVRVGRLAAAIGKRGESQ